MSDDGIPKKKLDALFKNVEKAKAEGSAANGEAGQLIKQAMDDLGLDRKAFNFVLGLRKSEETKRQGTLRGLIEYAHKAGMFDQVDAFDDLGTRLEEIAADIKKRREDRDPDAAAFDQGQPDGGVVSKIKKKMADGKKPSSKKGAASSATTEPVTA
jgi:uncharacterized protein (UPF0335 family)